MESISTDRWTFSDRDGRTKAVASPKGEVRPQEYSDISTEF